MSVHQNQLLDVLIQERLDAFIPNVFQTLNPGETFLPNWHVDTIAWHLEQCYHREIKRLIINVPPRHLKSICASIAFPAWVLGKDPTAKLICVSYGAELASKLARDTRTIMNKTGHQGLCRCHAERLRLGHFHP